MRDRSELQAILEEILGTGHVYFQPPASVEMQYPAIVYQRAAADTEYASNGPYVRTPRYQITVIDKDPDSLIPNKIGSLSLTRHEQFYVANNLNHDVFVVYL